MEWIYNHEALFWWLASSSLIIFLVTLIVVPLVAIRIPSDYFTKGKRRKKSWVTSHPVLKVLLLVCKNVFGSILVVTGFVMLLTPGQGLFTIFVGLMLMNFPGKYRLEKWLIDRRSVRRSVNWLRLRAGRSPLNFETETK